MATNNKIYPKVLILGNCFDEFSGAGVTLTNLFKDWPKEKIAVASESLDISYCEKERPCNSYYKLSFGVVSPKVTKERYHRNKKNKRSAIREFASYISAKTGRTDWAPSYKLNDDFLKFFDNFAPDVVYSALGSIAMMNFYLKLMAARKFKPVIHIWDDFVGRYNYRWFPSLWKRAGEKVFNKVLTRKDMLCLAIGDKMAMEYNKRYNREFFPFHNPVDPEIWDATPLTEPNTPVVSYFGKINKNTIEGVIDMCRAVEILNAKGIEINFRIHSGMMNIPRMNEILQYPHSKVADLLPREEIPFAFKSSTFLFFPISFDKKSVKYQKLSIQTKLTEYLISKVPIIMYSSPEIAVYEYLDKHSAAITCKYGSENIAQCLENALKEKGTVRKIADRAYNLAIKKHTVAFVRENFREHILNTSSK